MIHLTIHLLIQLIIIISLFVISLTLWMSVKRLREDHFNQKKAHYIEETQSEWYRYLLHPDQEFPTFLIPKAAYEIQGAEKICLNYSKNLTNAVMTEKLKHFANSYLKTYYQKLLHSRKRSMRMNALYRIVDFQIDSLLHECNKLENKRVSKSEYFLLLKVYSVFDSDRFLQKLKSSSISFSQYEYKKLFSTIDLELLARLSEELDTFPQDCQYSIIDSIGFKREMDSQSLLEALLSNENEEIRIRTLKAIYEISVPIDPIKYLPFVHSSIWEERLMMAKLLGNVSLSFAYPYLEELLEDESWWVRSQATLTIGNQRQGKEKLEAFIEKSTDPYAVDMVKQVLMGGATIG